MKSLISMGLAALIALSVSTAAHAQYLSNASTPFGSLEFWMLFTDDSGSGSDGDSSD